METKKSFAEIVAGKIIEQLEKGTAPWQLPWHNDKRKSLPYNPISDKRYKGINTIHLMAVSMSKGYSDPRWLTYKQASSLGGQVRTGEKSTLVQYWKFTDLVDKLDEDGKPILDKDGKVKKEEVKLDKPRVFYANVFNAEQIDNLPPIPIREQKWNPIERAETILENSGAKIFNDSDSAYYSPKKDEIHLPGKEFFDSNDKYYSTALHELGHWTGAESRLNRDLSHPFGSQEYAREELRAEIASMIIGEELNIGHDSMQHVAYVESWIKLLKDEPKEIFKAASDAEKIQDYVLGFEQMKEQKEEINLEQVKDNQNTILESIKKSSEKALEGYKAIETWENLSNVAKENGLNCYLTNNVPDIEADSRIIYVDNDDNILPIYTELSHGDGKAVTYINDERVKGTGFTSEFDWQKDALNNAIQEFNMTNNIKKDITWLNIPYSEKNTAKEIAGKLENGEAAIEWDKAKKQWFAKPGADLEKLKPWIPNNNENLMMKSEPIISSIAKEKVILAIPYSQKDTVKKIAGKLENGEAAIEWDKASKVWIAKPGADLEKLKPWIPDNVNVKQDNVMSPKEEFTLALQSLGCIVDGEHPIMDGQNHRIKVQGDKGGEKAGFYKAFLDGHPAGYIKNNRTGLDIKWKSKGYVLTDEEKAKLTAEAALKKEERQKEQAEMHEKVAEEVKTKFNDLTPVTESTITPYIKNKEIDIFPGLATDKDNKVTYVPAYDSDGKQWSTQYINDDGQKRFEKGSKKTGCFHVVGGIEALRNAPVIVISEGYATAASITKIVGYSTVAAFDSGNLGSVAKSLHEKYPSKPIIIAGDDDQRLEEKQGINPGKEKAIAAAKSVNGTAIFPTFAPGEKNKLTDFNDLATKSILGKEAIERQLKVLIKVNIEKQQQQQQQQQRQRQQQQQQKVKTRSKTLKVS